VSISDDAPSCDDGLPAGDPVHEQGARLGCAEQGGQP
jgi:hypothetical protein